MIARHAFFVTWCPCTFLLQAVHKLYMETKRSPSFYTSKRFGPPPQDPRARRSRVPPQVRTINLAILPQRVQATHTREPWPPAPELPSKIGKREEKRDKKERTSSRTPPCYLKVLKPMDSSWSKKLPPPPFKKQAPWICISWSWLTWLNSLWISMTALPLMDLEHLFFLCIVHRLCLATEQMYMNLMPVSHNTKLVPQATIWLLKMDLIHIIYNFLPLIRQTKNSLNTFCVHYILPLSGITSSDISGL